MRLDSQNGQRHGYADALRQAWIAIDADRPLEAERIAQKILEANAGHTEATKVQAYALLMQGKADDAVPLLEKLARSSRDPEIETQLAIALRHAGHIDKALLWLNRAVKRTPPFASAFHELGYVLHTLERSDEAIVVLRQGMAVAPMMIAMALQLGYVCYDVNDRATARNAFAHALSINSLHPEAIQGLATVLMDAGDFAQAAALFRQAVMANPDDSAARISLGRCLLELGDYETGYAWLRTAATHDDRNYGKVLQAILSSSRGRFWLKPSAAAKFFKD